MKVFAEIVLSFLLSICAYFQQWNISNTLFKYIFRAHFKIAAFRRFRRIYF